MPTRLVILTAGLTTGPAARVPAVPAGAPPRRRITGSAPPTATTSRNNTTLRGAACWARPAPTPTTTTAAAPTATAAQTIRLERRPRAGPVPCPATPRCGTPSGPAGSLAPEAAAAGAQPG